MKDTTPYIKQFNFLYFEVGPSAVRLIMLELRFLEPFQIIIIYLH